MSTYVTMPLDVASNMYLESSNNSFGFFCGMSLQVVKTNQFSVTKHKRVIRQVSGEHGLPGMVYCTSLFRFSSQFEVKILFCENLGRGVLTITQQFFQG